MPGGLRGSRDPDRLLDVGHRERRDHVGLGVGEGADLGRVVLGGLIGGELPLGVVAVVLRPDAAADHDRRDVVLVPVAQLRHQCDRPPVHRVQLRRAVADLRPPSRARAPGRALQHEAGAVLLGELEVGHEVAAQLLGAPSSLLEQIEGGELGQVEPAVEDQGGLDPAVGEEELVAQLRKSVPVVHPAPCLGA